MTELETPSRHNVPREASGPGTLHLRFLSPHCFERTARQLEHCRWPISKGDSCTISIIERERDLGELVRYLAGILSPAEQAAVRAIFCPGGNFPQVADCFEVEALRVFLARAQSGWLLDMMRQDRLMTMFQPIVHCHDPGQAFAYECLLRGIEGEALISPVRLLEVARGLGFLFQLDLAARQLALAGAARHRLETKIFINFTPALVYDPAPGLYSTVRAVDELGLRREQIVFEVIESELIRDVAHLKEVLDSYRECGFGVALDDLGSGYSSLSLLSQLRPDYVKLDKQLIRGVSHDSYRATIAHKLLEAAQGLKVRTIAEGVETQDDYGWLLQHGGDYAQGFLFAKPAAAPPLRPVAPLYDETTRKREGVPGAAVSAGNAGAGFAWNLAVP